MDFLYLAFKTIRSKFDTKRSYREVPLFGFLDNEITIGYTADNKERGIFMTRYFWIVLVFLWAAVISSGVGRAETSGTYNGLSWTVDDTHCVITAYEGSAKSLTIPEKLGGKPVEVIGEAAFSGNATLTNVTLPSGLTEIGDMAFSNCVQLKTCKITSKVTAIGEGAFANCVMLSSAEIPSSVRSIGTQAFFGCSSLKSVNIPNHALLKGNPFSACYRLTKIR